MKRVRPLTLIVWGVIAITVIYTATHAYFEDVKVPMPPKGEARTNPFYAAQRFAEALGARTSRDRTLALPPTSAIIALSSWHWELSPQRRDALQRWVESGGRLVVDRTAIRGDDFERWSGFAFARQTSEDTKSSNEEKRDDGCRALDEDRGSARERTRTAPYVVCPPVSSLSSRRAPAWALRDRYGIAAARVEIGAGSVTAIGADPFTQRSLFDGDHGRLFVAAMQLQPGDEVHFLSEDDYPSLVAVIWQSAPAVVSLSFALAAILLWRGAIRFGPLAAPPRAARRSLAEQIIGTGRFTIEHGAGEPLHAACVRALDEAAMTRIRGYAPLSIDERAVALASVVRFDGDAIADAMRPGPRGEHELRRAIAQLEAARRYLLITRQRSHGTS